MRVLIFFLLLLAFYYFFYSANPWDSSMTKDVVYTYIPDPYRLRTWTITKETDLHQLKYPLIFKPVMCNGISRNVEKINNWLEAYKYMNETDESTVIVQEICSLPLEAGVLYEKFPFSEKGKVISVVIKKNDSSSWKPLRCKNSKNDEGVDCVDFRVNSPKFEEAIETISKSIPNFYAGRYDIRFADVESLERGEFKVIELNGVTGFDLSASIQSMESYASCLGKIIFWALRRIFIGMQNVMMLNGVNLFDAFNPYKKVLDYQRCNDWEHLLSPSTA